MDIVLNIPAPQTSFIGRTDEINEIAGLLTAPDCHLLTLVGPGGAGKTRLSIEVANRVKSSFPDGVYFVPLEAARSADDLIAALMDATPFEGHQEACDCEGEFLQYLETKRLLLVLDNFEQLLTSVSLISDIVGRAQEVKLLVTSRVALDLQEEWVRRVEGLTLPNGDARPEESTAVQLFLNRAEQVRRLNALDLESVIQICRLVEGMPLAIELSAGWVNALTPADIAREIHTNIDILTSTRRNIEERHRSMRVVFDQSLRLLSEEERQLFQRLTVFCAGFTREAAEVVADASLQSLSVLVNRSLLHVSADGRYTIHELLRQYAWEAGPALRDQHMRFYLGMLQTAPLTSSDQLAALDQIESEVENIRRAWERAVETGAFRPIQKAAEGLSIYCDMRTQYQLGVKLLRQALDRIDRETLLASQLQLHLIRMAAFGGLEVEMDVPAELEHSLAIIEKFGTAEDKAFGVYIHGIASKMSRRFSAYLLQEQPDIAIIGLMQDSYDRFTELGIPFYQADSLTWLAWGELSLGREEDGMRHMQESLAIRQDMGDRHGAAWVLLSLAHAYYGMHDYQEAEACTRQAAAILREYHSIKGIVNTLTTLAILAIIGGQLDDARKFSDEVFDLSRTVNFLEGEISALGLLSILTSLVDEHYDVAMAMARQSRAINDRSNWAYPYPMVHAGMSFAACGLGDHDTMRRSFKHLFWRDQTIDDTVVPMILALEVVARAHEGSLVGAVELLALAQQTHKDDRKWMDGWALLTRTQAELTRQLDADTYAAAWDRGTALDLEATLRQIAALEVRSGAAPLANQSLPEPLTEREAEILRLVAAGLSNLEIADHLVLSVGTVKVHTRHIYQKLGVGSRTQAIAKASEIHLI